ncbi:MAG: phage holin family protein [bacterium]|nr:phage holin family protein [bacterium]
MISSLFLHILSGIAGLWVAIAVLPDVMFLGSPYLLLTAGAILGIVNAVVRPILHILTFPLRLLTFGLFSFVVNMATVWAVDVIFPELVIPGLVALFWTALIVWGAETLLHVSQKTLSS